MTLRLRMQVLVGVLTLLFLGVLGVTQLRTARESIKEETQAANRVAVQLLQRISWVYATDGTPALVSYLQGLGRVRSNDITVTDRQGRVLYRSPESPYKAGRHAPGWFAALLTPQVPPQVVEFPDGRLQITANASRAVLDAWDALTEAGLPMLLMMLVVLGGVAAWAQRIVRPFGVIVQGLDALKAGDFSRRLPALAGREAHALGQAFNRMAEELQAHIETEKRAVKAELQLEEQRTLGRWVDHRLDEERRAIARELHDELGQSVTALRSVATSLAHRAGDREPAMRDAALMMADECKRLYDAMHSIIPRLRPLVLDNLGLHDALMDLRDKLLRAHPGLQCDWTLSLEGTPLSHEAALTVYRATQEGCANALRHGQARQLRLTLAAADAGLQMVLSDDGSGLPPGPVAEGHYGLRWLQERCAALGGQARIGPRPDAQGAELRVWLPTLPAPPASPVPAPPVQESAP